VIFPAINWRRKDYRKRKGKGRREKSSRSIAMKGREKGLVLLVSMRREGKEKKKGRGKIQRGAAWLKKKGKESTLPFSTTKNRGGGGRKRGGKGKKEHVLSCGFAQGEGEGGERTNTSCYAKGRKRKREKRKTKLINERVLKEGRGEKGWPPFRERCEREEGKGKGGKKRE